MANLEGVTFITVSSNYCSILLKYMQVQQLSKDYLREKEKTEKEMMSLKTLTMTTINY